jgi:hypothetical protein
MKRKNDDTGVEANIRMCVQDFRDGMVNPPNLEAIQEYVKQANPDQLEDTLSLLLIAQDEYFPKPDPLPNGIYLLEKFINSEIESRWQYKLDQQLYKIKAIIRWLRYQMRIGIVYETYSENGEVDDMELDYNVGGYVGWYKARGKCIAFRAIDGTIQFRW